MEQGCGRLPRLSNLLREDVELAIDSKMSRKSPHPPLVPFRVKHFRFQPRVMREVVRAMIQARPSCLTFYGRSTIARFRPKNLHDLQQVLNVFDSLMLWRNGKGDFAGHVRSSASVRMDQGQRAQQRHVEST